jgi:hypothetical protein
MIKSGQFCRPLIYFIQCDTPILRMASVEFLLTTLDTLVNQNGIIIWERQGTYRLFTTSILRNAQLTCEASQQIKKNYSRITGASSLREISWLQGICIPSVIVQNLLLIPREECNSFSNPNSTANTTGKDQTNKP